MSQALNRLILQPLQAGGLIVTLEYLDPELEHAFDYMRFGY